SLMISALFPLKLTLLQESLKCVARNLGHDSVVCECNSTYCDGVGPVSLPPLGQYSTYLSSMAGSRMEPGQGQVQVNSTGAGLRLTIVPYQKYQRIKGFGGAMTDAAAINILSLSAGAQEQLLRQYFSKEALCASPWPAVTSPLGCTPTLTNPGTTT
uniref:Glucosylceramidase n=1 Tax=Xiphophorus couchianus TaxID=32473 RepID=A0A3B5MX53_9TELE